MVSFTLDTVKFLLIYILLSPSHQCRRPSSNEWSADIPVACRLVHCRQVEDIRNLNKKSFYFVTLTPSQSGWKPLFIGGVSGEGKGEGVRAEMGEGPFY